MVVNQATAVVVTIVGMVTIVKFLGVNRAIGLYGCNQSSGRSVGVGIGNQRCRSSSATNRVGKPAVLNR